MTGDWSETFLGLIAAATLIMAIVQIGVILVVGRLARQGQQLMATLQQDVKPLIARAHALVDDASRTVAVATAQTQKIDRLVTDLSRRVDETAAIVQQAIVTPAREGLAIFAAVRAGLSALRGLRDLGHRHGRQAEEEDPLFIG